ncbi:hypothetical protein BDB00DRAFT_558172 [Zychaea mexicana]|uniref:uncharacterized protein n=1 Tax=Zychaea mexicana TaxID=64656 RepID=UPI0022FDD322|nr:uncharacterized protein BDB00DRAFT_558172 [Zychaea mexicana]KAI9490334.1 hypothetical protein BDB00DRAFT_558172 [Zychaea mexicana]
MIVVFAGLYRNPSQHLQAEDRAHICKTERLGRINPIEVVYLLALDTIGDDQFNDICFISRTKLITRYVIVPARRNHLALAEQKIGGRRIGYWYFGLLFFSASLRIKFIKKKCTKKPQKKKHKKAHIKKRAKKAIKRFSLSLFHCSYYLTLSLPVTFNQPGLVNDRLSQRVSEKEISAYDYYTDGVRYTKKKNVVQLL